MMVAAVAAIGFLCCSVLALVQFRKYRRKIEDSEINRIFYAELVNQVSDCVCLVDRMGIIQIANEPFFNYCEKTPEKLIGKNLQRLQTDFVLSEHQEPFQKAISERGAYEFDVNLFQSSGEAIPFHLLVRPIEINTRKNGPQTYYCITAVDLKKTNEKDDYISQQQDKLLEIQHLAKLGYWEIDYATKKIYWSQELYSILGYEDGEIEPTLDVIYSMAYEDDQNRVWKAFLNAFQSQKKVDTQYRIRNNHGKTLDIYLRIRHFFSSSNQHLRTVGILQDITNQVGLREEINSQLIFKDTLLNNCSLLYIECDNDFRIRSINSQVSQLIGINSEAARGKQLLEIFGKLSRAHRNFVQDNMNFKKPMPLKDYKGGLHYIQWDHATFKRKNNEFLNILAGIDITETIEQRKAIEASFAIDAITQLPNRYKFDQVLDNYFEKNGKRQDKHLALLFIHIRDLYIVADGFGQNAEDQVLRSISERLHSAIGKYGLLARRYSNQFVLFYPCEVNVEKTADLCQLITRLLKIPFIVKDAQITLGSYIGVSKFPEHATSKEDLVRCGSAAMHEAQHQNVDYYVYSKDLKQDIEEKIKKYQETINE
jgi:diguanylate cyclase (GGDEF)-like protein/PAS domain S-box-containing protein